jgi:hypothetical protein
MLAFGRINWTPEECNNVKQLLHVAAMNCPADIDKYIADIDKYLEQLEKEKIHEENRKLSKKVQKHLQEKFPDFRVEWNVNIGSKVSLNYYFAYTNYEPDTISIMITSETDVDKIIDKLKNNHWD